MRVFFLVILCCFSRGMNCQWLAAGKYSRLDSSHLAIKVYAKSIRLRATEVIEYKANKKKGRVVLTKNFDPNGNIVSKLSRHFKKYRDYVRENYFYDSIGRIVRIVEQSSIMKKYYSTTEIVYNSEGKMKLVIRGFGNEKDFNRDTLFLFYKGDGRINFKIISHFHYGIKLRERDTIYLHYDTIRNVFLESSKKNYEYQDRNIYDLNGCVIGFSDTTDSKIAYVCDDFCNILFFKEETKINNEWVVTSKTEYVYRESSLTEFISYIRKKNSQNNELVLDEHITYKYNNIGQLEESTEYKKNGKLKYRSVYIYEYYP
jgi:hypothetical protein